MRREQPDSMAEIARRTGFHVSTVSRVLNNSARISAASAKIILAEARRLGRFGSVSGRTQIGILLPQSTMPLALYTLAMLNALRKQAVKRDVRLNFFHVDQPEMLNDRVLSGLISLDFLGRSAQEYSARFNLPLVCINDKPFHLNNICMVSSDEKQGMTLALEYLYSRGHRSRIGLLLIGNGESFGNHSRAEAFREVVAELGMTPEIRCFNRLNRMTELGRLLEELCQSGISALIVSGETQGPCVLRMLRQRGVNIPGELSLITWESSGFSPFTTPPLTALEQNFDALAAAAVGRLLAPESPLQDILIPYRLHRRSSVRTLAPLNPSRGTR